MKVCTNCGQSSPKEAKFCGFCGSPLSAPARYGRAEPGHSRNPYPARPRTRNPYDNQRFQPAGNPYAAQAPYGRGPAMSGQGEAALRTAVRKMKTSATIWTLIAIYQIIAGIITLLFGYGVLVLIMGIWNAVQSSKMRKNAAHYARNPYGITNAFESGKAMVIVFLFLNFFLGAFLGVIGSIYDLTLYSYVGSHKHSLLELERQANPGYCMY